MASAAIPAAALVWHLKQQYARRRARQVKASATDPSDFIRSGTALLKWLVDYRRTCVSRPVVSEVKPNAIRDSLPRAAPEQPEPFSAILSDLSTKIVPGLTHWENSECFFAYFKYGNSGTAGEPFPLPDSETTFPAELGGVWRSLADPGPAPGPDQKNDKASGRRARRGELSQAWARQQCQA